MQALQDANHGASPAYGGDAWTQRATGQLQQLLGGDVYFVYNGTGANTIGLRALVPPYGATICADSAHINRDEAGSVPASGGGRLLPVPAHEGKLRPEMLRELLADRGVEHHSQPWAVSISQPTEVGTVYSLAELAGIAGFCHEHGLRLHMDGARLANACVHLGCEPRELTAGVDILSFGGTKNGMMFGEALIVYDREVARAIRFHRKQLTQLNSKLRFIAAQFSALVDDDLYLRSAQHANAMAERLLAGVRSLERADIREQYPVQSNAVFLRMPPAIAEALQTECAFHMWEPGVYRLMCSFDTTPEQVDACIRRLKRECA